MVPIDAARRDESKYTRHQPHPTHPIRANSQKPSAWGSKKWVTTEKRHQRFLRGSAVHQRTPLVRGIPKTCDTTHFKPVFGAELTFLRWSARPKFGQNNIFKNGRKAHRWIPLIEEIPKITNKSHFGVVTLAKWAETCFGGGPKCTPFDFNQYGATVRKNFPSAFGTRKGALAFGRPFFWISVWLRFYSHKCAKKNGEKRAKTGFSLKDGQKNNFFENPRPDSDSSQNVTYMYQFSCF